jgi:hypothetical protein
LHQWRELGAWWRIWMCNRAGWVSSLSELFLMKWN